MLAELNTDNAAVSWVVNRLPGVTSIIAVILIAFALAHLIWLILTPPVPYKPFQTNTGVVVTQSDEQEVAMDIEVASLHLFGEAAVPEQDLSQDAPETRLNLRLLGMLAADDESAYAIIASGNSKEQFYRVGADIPGGATLKAVHPDRILLNRSGRVETLKLPRIKVEGFVESEIPDPVQQPTIRENSNNTISDQPNVELGKLRQEMLKNPQRLRDMIAVVPEKSNGSFSGFRISPRSDERLFSQLGLEEGDLVTSINGISLNAPQQGLAALQDLSNADDVTLTLLRDGSEVTLFQSFER